MNATRFIMLSVSLFAVTTMNVACPIFIQYVFIYPRPQSVFYSGLQECKQQLKNDQVLRLISLCLIQCVCWCEGYRWCGKKTKYPDIHVSKWATTTSISYTQPNGQPLYPCHIHSQMGIQYSYPTHMSGQPPNLQCTYWTTTGSISEQKTNISMAAFRIVPANLGARYGGWFVPFCNFSSQVILRQKVANYQFVIILGWKRR